MSGLTSGLVLTPRAAVDSTSYKAHLLRVIKLVG
jgi:hypothetical protein